MKMIHKSESFLVQSLLNALIGCMHFLTFRSPSKNNYGKSVNAWSLFIGFCDAPVKSL